MVSRGAFHIMKLSCTSRLRANVNLVAYMVFFTMSFMALLMHWKGTRFSTLNASNISQLEVDGVVLSMKPERFNHTQYVLAQLGLRVVQKVPPSFESKEVNQSLEAFIKSPRQHSATINSEHRLKVWSNHMAFVGAMEEFVVEASEVTPKRWRFFFEDDLAVNPTVTSEHVKVLIAKGLEIADEDGFVYLGICGPTCEDSRVLDKHVEAARCYGTCAHAFGFQSRTAALFLQHLKSKSQIRDIFMDQNMLNYGRHVKKVWVLGSNLKSPAAGDHVGLLYQDRITFPTTIG